MEHVLKPYDNRSDRQFDIVEIVYDFSMTQAARATKIACDNRKQKSYHVNRPLTTKLLLRKFSNYYILKAKAPSAKPFVDINFCSIEVAFHILE